MLLDDNPVRFDTQNSNDVHELHHVTTLCPEGKAALQKSKLNTLMSKPHAFLASAQTRTPETLGAEYDFLIPGTTKSWTNYGCNSNFMIVQLPSGYIAPVFRLDVSMVYLLRLCRMLTSPRK